MNSDFLGVLVNFQHKRFCLYWLEKAGIFSHFRFENCISYGVLISMRLLCNLERRLWLDSYEYRWFFMWIYCQVRRFVRFLACFFFFFNNLLVWFEQSESSFPIWLNHHILFNAWHIKSGLLRKHQNRQLRKTNLLVHQNLKFSSSFV